MKLYLAVATLMLVLIAQSEAAEEPTIEEHFANIQAKFQEFGAGLSEKTTEVLKKLGDSEVLIKTKTWFSDSFEKLKNKLDEAFS